MTKLEKDFIGPCEVLCFGTSSVSYKRESNKPGQTNHFLPRGGRTLLYSVRSHVMMKRLEAREGADTLCKNTKGAVFLCRVPCGRLNESWPQKCP